jgi:hypothetical protein
MRIHVAAVALLLTSPCIAFAQKPPDSSHAASAHAVTKPPKGEITLQGCLERESAYRRTANEKNGGPFGSGLGQGNEYVLTMGKPVPGQKAEPMKDAPRDGRVFSLTGASESNMVSAIGRQIEVVGTLTEPKAEKNALPIVKVTLWHPIADFCPAPANVPRAQGTTGTASPHK